MNRTNELENYLTNARIFLIDDSVPFQELTVSMFKKASAGSVTVASTLAEGMQGCEFISGHASTYNIPVVVVSGTGVLSTIDAAFSAGARDYFQKPLNLKILKRNLGSLLKRKSLQRPHCYPGNSVPSYQT